MKKIRSTLVVVVMSLLFLSPISQIQAQISIPQNSAPSSWVDFGGFVSWSFFCPCSGNFLLLINDVLKGPLFLMYTPGTQAFREFNLPQTNIWATGFFEPGGICLIPTTYGCTTFIQPQGTLTPYVGTSR